MPGLPPLVRQKAFTGGELSPRFRGHSDSEAYKTGLRLAKNFIPTPEGPIVNRPGTRYVCAVKDASYAPRLISFNFTDGQTFILEMGDAYIRFVQNGAQVLDGNDPYELVAPWAIADVPRLKWSQEGDVITFAHPSYPPQELQRISNTNWVLSPVSFVPAYTTAGLAPYIREDPTRAAVAVYAGPQDLAAYDHTTTYTLGDYVEYNGSLYRSLNVNNKDHAPSDNIGQWWAYDGANASPHMWCLTANVRDRYGNITESMPSPPAFARAFSEGFANGVGNSAPPTAYALQVPQTTVISGYGSTCGLDPSLPKTLVWTALNDSGVVGYNIYRSKKGLLWGWVGTTDRQTTEFKDDGNSPDFGRQPPKGANPFVVGPAETFSAATSYSAGYAFKDDVLYRGTSYGPGAIVTNLLMLNVLRWYDVTDQPAVKWNNAQSFNAGDQVLYNGLAYISKANGNVGNQPDLLAAWALAGWVPVFEWDVVTTFAANQYTMRDGAYYLSLQDNNTNNIPESSPTWWTPAIRYPGAVTNHNQRLIYGRSDVRPQDIWGSKIAQPHNFDVTFPLIDTDSFNHKAYSERLEEVRSLLSMRHLLVFTGQGVRDAEGEREGAISATSIRMLPSNRKGASYLDPLTADEAALYLTTRGRVRDLVYDWRIRAYLGSDISLAALHLLVGRTITTWAYAETPYSVAWAVRSDGALLSVTYSPQGIRAWARHVTAGLFEWIATVPETDSSSGVTEDAVYVVVKRIINQATVRYIERFSSRELPQKQATSSIDGTSTFSADARLCNFLDAAIEWDGRPTGGQTQVITLTGARFNAGDQITLTWIPATGPGLVPESPPRDLTADDVGSDFILDPDGLAQLGKQADWDADTTFGQGDMAVDSDGTVYISLQADNTGYSPKKSKDWWALAPGPIRLNIIDVDAASHTATVQLEQALPTAWQAVFLNIQDWFDTTGALHSEFNVPVAFCPKTLTGLDHLEGQSVMMLGDGAVMGPFDVDGGEITGHTPSAIAQIGLAYTSDLELLDLLDDAISANQKSVRKLIVDVAESRGIYAGETFDTVAQKDVTLYSPKQQRVSDGFTVPPLLTGFCEINIASSWNRGGRACIRQSDPLPLTIVAVTREIVVGGR